MTLRHCWNVYRWSTGDHNVVGIHFKFVSRSSVFFTKNMSQKRKKCESMVNYICLPGSIPILTMPECWAAVRLSGQSIQGTPSRMVWKAEDCTLRKSVLQICEWIWWVLYRSGRSQELPTASAGHQGLAIIFTFWPSAQSTSGQDWLTQGSRLLW